MTRRQRFIVTDTRGRTVKGKLSALSEKSLTLVTGGNIGARTFTRPDIVEVQKQKRRALQLHAAPAVLWQYPHPNMFNPRLARILVTSR